ncbi:MAG: hypothetical protein RLO51_11100 [Thalassobaculum sp.]|uniref:hypothetical protein n=1 Tax=Thalassobaculum sp. TaxID=2022740 RepID=UPI0032EB5B49
MLSKEHEREILAFINSELGRVEFGHLFIDVTITNSRATNIQAETKRSLNINR